MVLPKDKLNCRIDKRKEICRQHKFDTHTKPFTRQHIFGRVQIESICRQQIYISEMAISLCPRVENTVGKEEKKKRGP